MQYHALILNTFKFKFPIWLQIIFVLLPSKNSKTYRTIKPPFFKALVDVTGTHMAYTTTVHAQLVYFLTFVTRLRSQFEYRSFSYGQFSLPCETNDVYIRYNQNFNTLKFFSSCATFDDNTFAFKQQTRINAILLLNITSRIESIVLKKRSICANTKVHSLGHKIL